MPKKNQVSLKAMQKVKKVKDQPQAAKTGIHKFVDERARRQRINQLYKRKHNIFAKASKLAQVCD